MDIINIKKKKQYNEWLPYRQYGIKLSEGIVKNLKLVKKKVF